VDVSLQYDSPVPVEVRIGSLRATVPPNLAPRGPFLSAGSARVPRGRLKVEVEPHDLRAGSLAKAGAIGAVALTPLPAGVRRAPMTRACGRYVDWYEPRG